MTMLKLFFTGLALAAQLSGPIAVARGRHVGDQDEAYQARREGALLPLRSIENGVVPPMRARGADYIGAEYQGDDARYRLKFVRQGSVIWLDVDGRTGAVVGRAGQ